MNLKNILRNHDAQRKALCKVRDDIKKKLEIYRGNALVVIYLDDVLDRSIKIKVGRAEKMLRVSINSSGEITYGIDRFYLKEILEILVNIAFNILTIKEQLTLPNIGLAVVTVFHRKLNNNTHQSK